MRKLLTMAMAVLLLCGSPLGGDRAAAQGSSVLRVASGLASDNIAVLINRAIIVESTQPFIEVSVAQPAIADVSPLSDRTLYVFGKERGITTLTLLGENGALITSVTITVTPDINEVKQRLSEVLPTESIGVRLVGGNIALSGVVGGADKAERAVAVASSFGPVMNMMTIGGTQQVMIKIRVAEMSRNAAKSLGFDVGIFHQGSKVSNVFGSGRGVTGFGDVAFSPQKFFVPPTYGFNEDGEVEQILEGFTQETKIPTPVPSVELDAFGVLGTIARFGDIGLNITLQTLEQKGFSRTLAEPNLVALSGTSAAFLAGKDVPIPTVDQDGNSTVTFKSVGIKIDFTPTVLDNEIINLVLSTEVSSIDTASGRTISFEAGDVTTFSTKRANTTIELKDGQSFAIAGLLQDDFNDAISQFPWLGDIPILGTLFRSTNYARGESELVIIVSAHLVTPVNGDELSIPQDHVRIPNEMELFLLGKTVHPGAAGMVQSQGFDGDFGYVVE